MASMIPVSSPNCVTLHLGYVWADDYRCGEKQKISGTYFTTVTLMLPSRRKILTPTSLS